MWDKAVGDCLAALKFVRYRTVTSEMIKKPFTALYGDENILYFNKDSNNVDLMKWVFLVEILKMLILVGLIIRKMAQHVKFEKLTALKKMTSEELMSIAWHPNRWCNLCVSKDEKKEIDSIFIEDL